MRRDPVSCLLDETLERAAEKTHDGVDEQDVGLGRVLRWRLTEATGSGQHPEKPS